MRKATPIETNGAVQNCCVQLPVDLVRQLRVRAILDGTSTSKVAQDALEEYLKKKPA